MAKVIVTENSNSEKYVKSGDILLCNDTTVWLVIRLEDNDYLLYNMETSLYMLLDKGYIRYRMMGNRNGTEEAKNKIEYEVNNSKTIPLNVVNQKLGSRYGARDMEIRILRGDEITIKIDVPESIKN